MRITIAGVNGCGKSTVAQIIKRALLESGFTNVCLSDDEHMEEYLGRSSPSPRVKEQEVVIDMANVRFKAQVK